MVANGYEPIAIPLWAWHRNETNEILARRDVGELFRFVRRYAGASQSRIAVACGMAQGRVNEVMNGRREVTRLDVLTRIADGLGMPDESRAQFGLASRYPDREIVQAFPTQEDAATDIHRMATTASTVDILAVRGLGIVGLNSSLLRSAVMGRTGTALRVLLLHPDSEAAARRAAEIGESREQMAAGIRVAEASLRTMAEAGADVHLYWYATMPVWRIIAMDSTLYVSGFDADWEGHKSQVTKIAASPRGALYRGFGRMLAELVAASEQVI